MVISFLLILIMSAGLSAKVTNVYINDDGSENIKYDRNRLEKQVKKYTGKVLDIETVYNGPDKSWFGLLSLLQNKTSLGDAMERWYPADEVVNDSSIFPTYRDLKSGMEDLKSITDISDTLGQVFANSTRLYAITQRNSKNITMTAIKNALEDVDGHEDFITCSGKYTGKACLHMSGSSYKKLQIGLKKVNVVNKAVKIVDAIVNFAGVISKRDTLSNNTDKRRINDYINSHMTSTIDGDIGRLNIIAHGDGALLVNKALEGSSAGNETSKITTTGSVDNYVWNDGKNFSLMEDIFVAATYGAISRDSGLTNYSSTTFSSVGEYWALNFNRFGYFMGHDFSGVYLSGGSKTTGKIVNQFVKNYNELKSLDNGSGPIPEKRENLWLGDIELEGYGVNVPQRKSIKFDSRAFYSSNEKPTKRKARVCYALSKTPYWRTSDFVRGPRYSYKYFTTKDSSQKISNVSFLVPKTIPLGTYYIMEYINCYKEIKETDYDENQVKWKKINVVADEVEDVYSTKPSVAGSGSVIKVKNTMVYRGSTENIGDVYNLYYISTEPKFSTSKMFAYYKTQLGWNRQRRRVTMTMDISKFPVGTFYIWVITQTPDLSHDDDTSNNYFRLHFTTQPKSNWYKPRDFLLVIFY